MEWKIMSPESLPPKGTKFVALYDDGSGARIYLRDDAGDICDCEGEAEDVDYLCHNLTTWAPVPDDYELWMEHSSE